jgi:hypothetical protein
LGFDEPRIAVLLPFLGSPLKTLLSYFTIAPTLIKGANSLLNKGIKVEVLDGIAVGVALMLGEYFTAVATHVLNRYVE